VLACPIVYVERHDGPVRLTDPTGNHDLQIFDRASCGNTEPIAWSQSGQKIGFTIYNNKGEGQGVVIEPASGRIQRFPSAYRFYGWGYGDRAVIGVSGYGLCVLDTDSGAVTAIGRVQQLTSIHELHELSPLPPTAGAGYIAFGDDDTSGMIILMRKDFTQGRVIWRGARSSAFNPRVDPMGEYVAWGGGGAATSLKRLRDGLSVPPIALQLQGGYRAPCFCDWTEDGNLLVAAYAPPNTVARLLVVTRDGKVLRELMRIERGDDVYMAAWRKYTHQ